jgi:ketosteroid isomerase-like protein
MSTTTQSFDISALAAAIEADDPAAQAAYYAGDAVVEVVDRDHTPSSPLVLRGADEIRAAAEDTASRNLTHTVRSAVASGDAAALLVACSYPDGTNVMCSSALEHRDGRIVRETRLQVWDA